MTTAVLAAPEPDATLVVDSLALLKSLRAGLCEQWKTDVMNAAGCILRDAFAAVGFGLKQCFNYAPLIHEHQVACLWLLELNDDLAIAAAAAEVAGTDVEPREIPNMAVRVKIVFREVLTTVPDGTAEVRLLCSLAFMVPAFEVPVRDGWLEHELVGVTIPVRDRSPEDVTKSAQAQLLRAVQPEQRPILRDEALKLADYVLRGLAP